MTNNEYFQDEWYEANDWYSPDGWAVDHLYEDGDWYEPPTLLTRLRAAARRLWRPFAEKVLRTARRQAEDDWEIPF